MSIVDAHHHIWRQADMPWLSGPMQPRIFGPYAAIRRDYLIDEFLADISGSEVVKSVYVQANWPTDRFEDEVAWVSQVAEQSGWPHGIVGYADVTVDDVRPQLDRLKKYPLMRGVRMQLHWHENQAYRFAARPDLATDAKVQRNVARLADYGWGFDLQVFAPQMAGAAQLAAACPRVTFILQHAGMLEDLSERGWEAWRAGMRLLAAQPNVVSKTSALGTFIHRNDAAHVAAVTRETVAIFGASRCLFGSNFPIEKLWTTYPELIAAHRAAAAELPAADQRHLLHDTAMRVYRLAQ
jgi:predicted TIM-barrel fold metal-dependent hydrolase